MNPISADSLPPITWCRPVLCPSYLWMLLETRVSLDLEFSTISTYHLTRPLLLLCWPLPSLTGPEYPGACHRSGHHTRS
ncbi:hypothetical protein RSAG8_07337, partial [Rhizoctonia solani AG-8 WAC10335]